MPSQCRSPEAKAQARALPELKLERSVGQYEIYRVTTTDGRYVEPLAVEPVLFRTDNWKRDFHKWFVNPNLLDIPLVYVKHPDARDRQRFPLQSDSFLGLPRVALPVTNAVIAEKLGPEDIEFTTNLIGHPHLVRVSYHPNWHVSGADRVYLAAPSFMLVYPTTAHVKLHFGRSVCNDAGDLMALAGVAILLWSPVRAWRRRTSKRLPADELS